MNTLRTKSRFIKRVCPLLVMGVFLFPGSPVGAGDWPFWRGPEQTGIARETGGVSFWSQEGENLLWRVPVGGRTTPIVMGGRIFFISPVGEGVGRRERVVCLDASTGKTLWEYAFNVFHSTIVENRVGWTALVGDPETGNVYAHGTGGEFFCFSRGGTLLWKVSMTEMFGRISGYGGRLHTPIIDEDRVIVSFLNSGWGSHARPLHRYVAFDKRTGAVLWWAAPGGKPLDTTYSVPAVAVIGGVRMMVAANADGNVYGMEARTGKRLWTFRLSKRGINSSVVIDGKYAYVGHSEENISGTSMGRVVCIDASKRGDITETGEVWRVDELKVGYASPAIANGRLYVVENAAVMHALDLKTGRRLWKYKIGRVSKGSPVVSSDGVIYVGEQNGVFLILQDQGDHCILLDRETFTRDDRRVDEMFGSPAVVDGRVYFMTRYSTYCLGTRGGRAAHATKRPPVPAEAPRDSVLPVTLHIVPGEVTLMPGESASFGGAFFNDQGQALPAGSLTWSVKGVKGAVDSDGRFTASDKSGFSAGFVVGRSGDLEARARVRISQPLPLSEDFESMVEGKVPPGWIGVAAKTKLVRRDGSMVLQKLSVKPSPPFMRIKAYITPPIAGGYTIVADMLGTPKGRRFKPDMGLVNSRYTMSMMGIKQVLRVESWSPLPRIRKDVPLSWEPNVWYRVKMSVEVGADQAIIRGKVWPRKAAEPEVWTIELIDPFPNREGSPGLYAYSPGTTTKSKGPEVFFDNVQVKVHE